MKSNTPTFVIELLLCVNDQQNRLGVRVWADVV